MRLRSPSWPVTQEVRCFFNWCVAAGLRDDTPFRGLRNVRLPTEVIPPLPPDRGRPPARSLRPGPLLYAATGPGELRPGVRLQSNGLKQLLRRRGRAAQVSRCHAHRFRHTFATWAIAHDARELDVQHILGHSSPDMVRRYSATYRSAQAAERHAAFSPGDQMLGAAD